MKGAIMKLKKKRVLAFIGIFLLLPFMFTIAVRNVVIPRWHLYTTPNTWIPTIAPKTGIESYGFPFQYYYDGGGCDLGGPELSLCRHIDWVSLLYDLVFWMLVSALIVWLIEVIGLQSRKQNIENYKNT